MSYYTEKHKEFGIPHGGDVETPILGFLYNRRENETFYYVERIANGIGISNKDSVRDALNRLATRRPPYVIKDREGKYTIWRLSRNANVYREVERRIGNYRGLTSVEYTESYEEEEDYITEFSSTAIKLLPLKTALQAIVPQAALPLEAGYLILSSLDTIRNIYNLTTATSTDEFEAILNKTIKNAAQLAYTHVVDIIAQPMRDTTIPTIVESSSKYLEQKEIFKDFSEALNLDDYSDDFKDFYEASLSNYLKDMFNRYEGQVR